MKALKATAGTSQPVLSCQDIQTVFFQVPELLALHRDFYQGLKARLEGATEPDEGLGNELHQGAQQGLSVEQEQGLVAEHCKGPYLLSVGDLFQKLVSLCDIYASPVMIAR